MKLSTEQQRKEHRAHVRVQQAIKRGDLVRPDLCQQCNTPGRQFKDGRASIQAHHYKGYDYPLDVQWLCVVCHFSHDKRANGERQGSARLTADNIREIRRLYVPGKRGPPIKENSLPGLARKFNVSHVTIDRIIKRKIWTHIE